MNFYLPHIITPEAKKYFSEFKDKDIIKKLEGFGDDFGFGREFSGYGKSRTLKIINEAGELIENPTIAEVNKYFSKQLDGNKVFL